MDEFKTFRGYELQQQKEGQFTPAMEDYLEMIYRLCQKQKFAKLNILSKVLNVRPSSAFKMVSKLSHLGYLEYNLGGVIFLTPKGERLGKYLNERHSTIFSFLSFIGSKKPLLETELVEHLLSDDTIEKLKLLTSFFERNENIKNEFIKFMENSKRINF